MCYSRGICGGNNRPNRSSSSEGTGSGAHYALCALGVGLIALGIVMIVWTVIPIDGEASGGSPTTSGNSTTGPGNDEGGTDSTKSSTVAIVLVGVGVVMLFLSICFGVRSKRRARNRSNQPVATGVPFMDHVAREQEEPAADSTTFNVPSYEEVVGSSNYPIRQSNLRNSTSQLPSYEDIIAAVENEGTEPANNPTENAPLNDPTPALTQPAADPPGLTSNLSLPTRSSSRASRLLRPLRVRRIKSDKLHLKDFRLQIRSPTQNPVTIEPITPPPQYENKIPELG
ncbi:transmembrane protein 51b [Siniperca chuatsi]|uniref:transmembrane protein 51b n=1 Tax=Siniperca chuatsi TaxID=119488 RepID=UPI001CE21FC7|nr:transmembrane protein 51b [Siniperca chuatsi]XP_044067245.1 transmembrane protein 51b [Siniperca chuatsi]XP_044067255.1 transmembrane protein 51b [Siniperca chuatsi]